MLTRKKGPLYSSHSHSLIILLLPSLCLLPSLPPQQSSLLPLSYLRTLLLCFVSLASNKMTSLVSIISFSFLSFPSLSFLFCLRIIQTRRMTVVVYLCLCFFFIDDAGRPMWTTVARGHQSTATHKKKKITIAANLGSHTFDKSRVFAQGCFFFFFSFSGSSLPTMTTANRTTSPLEKAAFLSLF